MDRWGKFNEETLPDKESFYRNFNLESITDEDYVHAKKVWEVFKIKSLAEYHDLYVQSNTLLVVDVFENFRDSCIDTYELDPAHFFIFFRISLASLLKKDTGKIRAIN